MYDIMVREAGDNSCVCRPCTQEKEHIQRSVTAKAELDKYFRGPLCRHDTPDLGTWLTLERTPTIDDLPPPDHVYLGALLTAWYNNYSDPEYQSRNDYKANQTCTGEC